MNILDALIILFLGLGFVIGFKRGFFKQTVIFVGTFAVLILSFILKDPIAEWLVNALPFINFGGFFEGLIAINIIFYQFIGFLLAFSVLSFILKLLIIASGIFEKILKLTIILGIPSKILGAVVGFLNYYIIVYIVLFLISLPIINIEIINQSNLRSKILNNSPILSKINEDLVGTFNDIIELKEEDSETEKGELNNKIIDIIIKNGIATKEYIEKLELKGKINTSN